MASLTSSSNKNNNNNNNNNNNQISTSRVILIGPEASGKTTLVNQLKHFASNSPGKCQTISDPSLLIVNPTTGQEVDEFVLKGASSENPFSVPELLEKLNAESERNLRMAARIENKQQVVVDSSKPIRLPLAACFEEEDPEIAEEINSQMNNVDIVKKDETELKSNNAYASSFETELKIEIKEFGGRMAPMWDKFISSSSTSSSSSSPNKSTTSFDKLIFVVDVITPAHLPLASVEFWKCVKKTMSQSASPTSSGKKFLLFINKIRCPVVMRPKDVIEAMMLDSTSSNQGGNRNIIMKNLSVVVGDTWSGEGVPLVAAWLLS